MHLTFVPGRPGIFCIVIELTNWCDQENGNAPACSRNNASQCMVAFIIENSKLIMVFLLIGTIIGLSAFANRPYRREAGE
jgi:hypothetical protein